MPHIQTPSQTIGPFFAYGLTPEQYGYAFTSIADGILIDEHVPGERITVVGTVTDGEEIPVSDALIEIWQADAGGQYPTGPPGEGAFNGFGRVGTGTDARNRFRFETIKPGSVAGQAPHINVIVFMRGLLNHLFTRIYFADEAEANARDPVLNTVPQTRRATLIAPRHEAPGRIRYTFNIRMQGKAETVFFDV